MMMKPGSSTGGSGTEGASGIEGAAGVGASGCCAGTEGFGAAGATAVIDPEIELAVFYAQHILNPREEYYQPRIRDIVYRCL